MPPTMSRPTPTGSAAANSSNNSSNANGNGNVVASADPFYVFKEELETKVSSVHQRYTKWKAIYSAAAAESTGAKDLPALTSQLTGAVASADKSLKFLEQTIVMVEANRAKFEHIDAAEIASRRAFVSAARAELLAVSTEISSDAVQSRIRKEERKLLLPSTKSAGSTADDNARFLDDQHLRQSQLLTEQDASLDGLAKSVTSLNAVAVEISHEIKTQNKMLDDLTDDVVETQERMNVVMERMSRLLKTKNKCQLGLILFLVFVLVVMVFLVIYT